MRLAAGATALLVLAVDALLVHREPASFGWLYPRGGMVTLAISLALAYGAIHAAGDAHRTARQKFEWSVAGWLWLLVQAGASLWYWLAAH
jgi:hypothetical protein